MFRFFTSTLLTVALAFATGGILAQDLAKGLAAAQTGDFATALKEWRPLAEQGDATAQYHLGVTYTHGRGVLQDYAEAMKWYLRAAKQGQNNGRTGIGLLYEFGDGVLQDSVRAYMWYNIASANGDKPAAEWRDKIAAKVTTADISKAQPMARECISSNYKNCGW